MQTSNSMLGENLANLEEAIELTDTQMANINGGKKGDIVVIAQPIIVSDGSCGAPIVPINIVITGKGKK